MLTTTYLTRLKQCKNIANPWCLQACIVTSKLLQGRNFHMGNVACMSIALYLCALTIEVILSSYIVS